MLKTAYGTLNSSVPFVYEWFPYDFSPTIYFCFHFAEIEKLSSGTVREMSIVLNDIYTIAPSVILQYLVPQTICTTSAGIPVNINEENYLRISAASGSKLPPIINGFELFYFANLSYSPTFSQDGMFLPFILQFLFITLILLSLDTSFCIIFVCMYS